MTAAELLMAIAKSATLFRAPDGTAYATFDVGYHRETWPVRAVAFRQWLLAHYFESELKPPPAQALADAVSTVAAQARYGAHTSVQPVYVRVAGDEDALYLDLADEHWRAVAITDTGWNIVADPPVKFRRSRGMLALPTPVHGGSLHLLRGYLNLASDEQWALLTGWLVATLRPRGPYPVLALIGEQGSAKTTCQKMLRRLIDPNVAPVRSEPRDPRDVAIAANNSWLLGYDNLSEVETWLSDCFCRLATGGGFGTRELYSDNDEVLFDAQRPVMLNGIDAVIARGDLFERSIIVDLPRIPEAQRRREDELWAQFEEEQDLMLGALLDAVVVARQRLPDVHPKRLPRMADFACWAMAAEPGLGLEAGAFIAAYDSNRREAHSLSLEASAIAGPIQELAAAGPWTGTPTELLAKLCELAQIDTTKPYRPKGWPKTPRYLSGDLKRIAPNLLAVGVAVVLTRTRESRQVSVTSVTSDTDCENTGEYRDASRDARAPGDATRDAGPAGSDTDDSAETRARDARDASDASLPPLSCSGCHAPKPRVNLTKHEGGLWCPSCLWAKSDYRGPR
jgi:hypothetical protein